MFGFIRFMTAQNETNRNHQRAIDGHQQSIDALIETNALLMQANASLTERIAHLERVNLPAGKANQ